jgi:hypothetical protein
MALTAKNRRGVQTDADFLSAISKADTDGDGIPELVDAFGHAIAFFPWPTPLPTDANYGKIAALAPAGNQFQDVEDPTGTLLAPAWLSSSNGATFQALCHPVRNQYMTPFLVSAGANPTGQVWLNPDMSCEPAPVSPLTYNIYVPSK